MILKIQLLRLVHNFCSHSAYKHVLLSYSEMDELKQLYLAYETNGLAAAAAAAAASLAATPGGATAELLSGGSGVPSPSTSTAGPPISLPYCTGGSGLLSKIIRVLKNVPTSSIFRFVNYATF